MGALLQITDIISLGGRICSIDLHRCSYQLCSSARAEQRCLRFHLVAVWTKVDAIDLVKSEGLLPAWANVHHHLIRLLPSESSEVLMRSGPPDIVHASIGQSLLSESLNTCSRLMNVFLCRAAFHEVLGCQVLKCFSLKLSHLNVNVLLSLLPHLTIAREVLLAVSDSAWRECRWSSILKYRVLKILLVRNISSSGRVSLPIGRLTQWSVGVYALLLGWQRL